MDTYHLLTINYQLVILNIFTLAGLSQLPVATPGVYMVSGAVVVSAAYIGKVIHNEVYAKNFYLEPGFAGKMDPANFGDPTENFTKETELIPTSRNLGYLNLHKQAQRCSVDSVKKLFARMDPQLIASTTDQGDTPILLAVENDNLKVVNFLVSNTKPEDINKGNNWGDTPLDHAVCNRQIGTAKLLLSTMSIEGVIRPGGDIMTIKKDSDIKGWVARYRKPEEERYVGSNTQKILKSMFKPNKEVIEKLVNDKLLPFKDILATYLGHDTSKTIYDYLCVSPRTVDEDEANVAGSLNENEND